MQPTKMIDGVLHKWHGTTNPDTWCYDDSTMYGTWQPVPACVPVDDVPTALGVIEEPEL